jgi:hypothetical protein
MFGIICNQELVKHALICAVARTSSLPDMWMTSMASQDQVLFLTMLAWCLAGLAGLALAGQ